MYIKFIFSILVSIFFISCQADINLQNISDEISLHPDLIVPVGSASMSLEQLITNNDSTGAFEIGKDDEINYIIFDSSEFKISDLNLLDNSRELIERQYPSPNSALFINPESPIPSVTNTDSVRLGINFNKQGDRIDSTKITSATFSVIVDVTPELISIPPSDMKFTILFPNGKIRMLDGSSNSISFTPTSYGTVNNVILKNFMLITSGGATGIPIIIRVDAKSGNLPLTLTPASIITSRINFTQLDYSVAYGNIKSKFNVTNAYVQAVDYEKKFPTSVLKFANPQVYITAVSNIGTYLNFKIDSIKGYQSINPQLNPVYANFNGVRSTTIELKRRSNVPGDTVNFRLPVLNKGNGGIDRIFADSPMPDKLKYLFSTTVDPVMNSQHQTPWFITSDAEIKVNLKTILPLDFTKDSYYEYQNSIQNVFNTIENTLNSYTSITYINLILNVTNGLPSKVTFSLYPIDSTGNALPQIFDKSYLIAAGNIDANGIVQPGKETKQTINVTLSKDQLITLRKAVSINYKIRMEGDDISNIHFIKSNIFDLKVGLFVKGDINTTLGKQTQK
jgi:hypothetical protein